MLPNPFRDKLPEPFPGTRLLQNDFGLVGATIQDPHKPERVWTIQALFAPLPRALGGVRARCEDQKGFISFLDQMSLEILLGLAIPGSPCHWAGRDYPHLNSTDWFGFCADPDDLVDDLYMRELSLRADSLVLPTGTELHRRLHLSYNQDVEELFTLVWDGDRSTGKSPDTRMGTLAHRWAKVCRDPVIWEALC